MIGVALYQGYRGITKKFLKDSKVEEMSPRVEEVDQPARDGRAPRADGRLRARRDLPGQGRDRLQPEARQSASTVRWRRSLHHSYGPLAARDRRCRPDRVRALLAERRPLPQNLSGDNGQPRRPSRFDGVGAARAKEALFAAECWFGDQLSRQICAHHRRRLRRIGWESALEPPSGGWAAGDPPARSGNAVDVLIDGEQALPAIAEELQRGPLACPPDGLALLTGLRTHTRRRAGRTSQPPRGARRAGRRARPHLGRSAAAALSSLTGRREEAARPSSPLRRESSARSIRRNGRCIATTKRRS